MHHSRMPLSKMVLHIARVKPPLKMKAFRDWALISPVLEVVPLLSMPGQIKHRLQAYTAPWLLPVGGNHLYP